MGVIISSARLPAERACERLRKQNTTLIVQNRPQRLSSKVPWLPLAALTDSDMHRCLEIYDILNHIMDNMSQPTSPYYIKSGPRLRDLLSVALVSKAFCEPALDALWVSQDSLPLLFKTLPQDLWFEKPKKLVTLILCQRSGSLLMFHSNKAFRRLLTKAGLDRFLYYGKKMRKLRVEGEKEHDPSSIDSSAFHMISLYLNLFYPGRTVFPGVRELDCCFRGLSSESIWELIQYLSPSIQCVRLNVSLSTSLYPRLPVLALLSTLPSKLPFIEQLIVNGFIYSKPCILQSLLCNSRFTHLSVFECPEYPVNLNALGHLAHLPKLGKASLAIEADHFSTIAIPAQPFPSLRELNVSALHFACGIEFIRSCLPSVSLNSIEFRTPRPPSSAEIGQLFSALSSHLVLQSLTSVSLKLSHNEDYAAGPTLEFGDFEPLLQFNALQTLRLSTAFSLEHLSDNLLVAISLAWPQLRILVLQSRLFDIPPSRCTFYGILHLAEHCHYLWYLAIPFMASEQTSWRPGGGPTNQSLLVLDVGKPPIGDSQLVASLLSDVFPNLQKH